MYLQGEQDCHSGDVAATIHSSCNRQGCVWYLFSLSKFMYDKEKQIKLGLNAPLLHIQKVMVRGYVKWNLLILLVENKIKEFILGKEKKEKNKI